MATEQAFKSKVTVRALCTFSTGKPSNPPLDFSLSYFRYNSNKLDFFPPCILEHSKSKKQKEV